MAMRYFLKTALFFVFVPKLADDCGKHTLFDIFFETIYLDEKFSELGFFNSKEGFWFKIVWKRKHFYYENKKNYFVQLLSRDGCHGYE